MNHLICNKGGFTLVELLTVTAIIGILAAISIPLFANYRAKSFDSSAQSDLRNMKVMMEGYYYDMSRYN